MDKGPHIIPLVPGGVPVIIHASQGEGVGDEYYKMSPDTKKPPIYDISFLLLEHDNTYHVFTTYDDKNVDHTNDELHPAVLHYVRPDGVEDTINMRLNRDNYVIVDSGGNRTLSDPHHVFLRDFPKELTEVAGDVICEIVAYKGSNPDGGDMRSANFILRVEPRPSMNANPHITYSDMPIDQSGNQNNETAGTYYSGDADEATLITWGEVVNVADTGDLREILSPGTLIRPVKLASGELMGMRCVHVADYKTAYFEPLHLFLSPKKFNKSATNTPKYVYGSEAAMYYLGSDLGFYEKNQEWISQLPYSVRSRIAKLEQYSAMDYIFGGTRMINNVMVDVQLDLYKTAEGRIKTSSDGVARDWYVVDIIGAPGKGTVVVESGGLEGFSQYAEGADIYVNPIFYIVGKDHQDPSSVPVDIQSWADVKSAAAQGKLLNSNLTVGQLMPELPTVGVLRCVHITENWAAFDQTELRVKASANLRYIPYNDSSSIFTTGLRVLLTKEERDIFTALATSTEGNGVVYNTYAQSISAYNLNLSGANPVFTIYNYTLWDTRFDYYADNDITKRIKNGPEGTPVEYWAGTSGTGSNYAAYYLGKDGKLATNNIGNSGRNPEYYVDPVFVVGTIS